jgi:hypothetical protein
MFALSCVDPEVIRFAFGWEMKDSGFRRSDQLSKTDFQFGLVPEG